MEKFNESMIGKKVKMASNAPHEEMSDFYPVIGTVGTIVEVWDELNEIEDWAVRWPEGSVKKWSVLGAKTPYTWFCGEENLELVEEESCPSNEMTDEEIWKMLEPKMTKNGFVPNSYYYDCCGYTEVSGYDCEDFKKAVSLAYKVGYMRCKKGKPFAYKRKGNAKNED